MRSPPACGHPMENNQDSPSLDSSLAPALLFEPGYGGGAEAGKEIKPAAAAADDPTTRFLYSIPKRRLLVVRGLDYFTSDAAWITPQGWVLVLDPNTRDASLRDPLTSRTVRLPSDQDSLLPSSNRHTRCFLSMRRPADDDCIVLVVHLEDPVLWYCRPRGGRWCRHEYSPELVASNQGHDDDPGVPAMGSLTAARGKFYTRVRVSHVEGDELVTLEFSPGPIFSRTRVVMTPCLPGMLAIRLIESCGDLFLLQISMEAFCCQGIIDIYVYKLFLSNNISVWERVATLGDSRVFFSGRDKDEFGASMAADEVGLKANCIYFTCDDDKGLYMHDLERGTTVLHNPGPQVPDSIEPLLLMPCAG